MNKEDKIFYKKQKPVTSKAEFEEGEEVIKDSFENTPLYTLENVARKFIVWPSALPTWIKVLMIVYIALNFHVQTIVYLFTTKDLALEKLIAVIELSYGWLFYSKMISGIVHNREQRGVMDDIKFMWKKCK